MKLSLIVVAFFSPLLASCAHPLERAVDAQKFQRIEAAAAGKPLQQGASDGIGNYIATSRLAQAPVTPAR